MSAVGVEKERVGKESTALAALSRSLVNSFIFFFKRPIRLFRPVKISAFQGISHLATQTSSSVFQTVRTLIQREGIRKFVSNHLLPPFVINTLTGFVLFTTYTSTETYLTKTLLAQKSPSLSSSSLSSPPSIPSAIVSLSIWERIGITFGAGAIAGATQSIISSPLDNVRILLAVQERSRGLSGSGNGSGVFRGWPHLIWTAITIPQIEVKSSLSSSPTSLTTTNQNGTTTAGRRIDLSLVRSGWNFYGLSLIKDSLAFGSFFLTFQLGRQAARSIGLSIDSLSTPSFSDSDSDDEGGKRLENNDGGKKKLLRIGKERTTSGLIVQSGLILVSGTAAGWIFNFISRPFDRVRSILYSGRSDPLVGSTERSVGELLREARERSESWRKLLFAQENSYGVGRVVLSPSQIAHLPAYFPPPSPRASLPPNHPHPHPQFRRNQVDAVESRWRRVLMKSGRVLKYAPIYSVGYFAFALVSGDLE